MPPLASARPATVWTPRTLSPRRPIEAWTERLDTSIIWDEIRSYSDIQKNGASLFSGTAPERRRKWVALNNFCRQARAYHDALDATKGSSRGLLGYYSALNLAKAELLHFCPQDVIDVKIHHGLGFSFSPQTISGDYVIVNANGVFPRLYEARMGKKIPAGSKLPVKRLLGRVPEIGREFSMAFGDSGGTDRGWFRILGNGNECWPVVMLTKSTAEMQATYEWPRIEKRFENVQLPGSWRTYFPDLKVRHTPQTYLQGRRTFPASATDECGRELYLAFGDSVEAPLDGHGDFHLSYSLYKSKLVAMPTYLARYTAMFYLSNLVRYRPSRLNPQTEQSTAWLLEAYARQSPDYLLANGLEGILQKNVIFDF